MLLLSWLLIPDAVFSSAIVALSLAKWVVPSPPDGGDMRATRKKSFRKINHR